MTVNVLGTNYEINIKKYSEDPLFEKNSIEGYCNGITKQIVICDMQTAPGWDNASEQCLATVIKEIKRHEIVHAFLTESGLADSSLQYTGGWAKNEELVDWIALQGVKIYNAWESVNAI